MNDDLVKLAMIDALIDTLSTEEKTEVADLVEQLRVVLAKASEDKIASAAFAKVSVLCLIESRQTN